MNKVKRGRKPKYMYVFLLKDVHGKSIYKNVKKDIQESSIDYSNTIIHTTTPSVPLETTVLTTETRTDLFLDKNTFIIMQDHIEFGSLPERTDLRCWHDHHTFNTSPIGLPIKYTPKNKTVNDYFTTIGVFCSFPCCLAYINENNCKDEYKESKSLLFSLYYKIYGKEYPDIVAPSYKCLKDYGGKLNITEFRNNFSKYRYIITDNIKRPYMVAVGNYIEEKKCGFF